MLDSYLYRYTLAQLRRPDQKASVAVVWTGCSKPEVEGKGTARRRLPPGVRKIRLGIQTEESRL